MTGVVGALVEAWDELRIHRLRVLLALIGVAVAVAAITAVTAAVDMLSQAMREQNERDSGRSVTLQVNAWPATAEAASTDTEAIAAQYDLALERYGIEYSSRTLYSPVPVRFPDGTRGVDMQAVDPDLGVINRIVPVQGRWFVDQDVDAFAPMLVVNEAFMQSLGLSDLSTHPTVLIGDTDPVRATIIGVTAQRWTGEMPSAFWLYDQFERWWHVDPQMGQPAPTLAVWVPTDQADALSERLARDVQLAAPGWQVDVYDNRMNGMSGLDGATRWIGLGFGVFALLLGGLGLVNISLVTVRYRIREIGIRRSFGATSARIFFGVMLESVVATLVAGFVGVAIAVAGLKAVPFDRLFGSALQDTPPFPVSAALVGLGAALAV
ncbi:MAG: ABC transporter permease, partial [Cellulomonadaceae bacterium]|nr:ABC transporter permease [Cellulomonadaceae bacterium]